MSEYNDFVNGLLKQAAESLSPAIGITNPNSAVNSLISGATGINPGSAISNWIQSNTGQLTERDRAMMQWQEDMRSNEVQTHVKDLEAAGLNPALMYSKGQSSASMPSVPSSAPAASMSELVALATLPEQLKAMRLDNAIRAKDVEWYDKEHGAKLEYTSNLAAVEAASADELRQRIEESRKRVEDLDADIDLKRMNISKGEAEESLIWAQRASVIIDNSFKEQLNPLLVRAQELQNALNDVRSEYEEKRILAELADVQASVTVKYAEAALAGARKEGVYLDNDYLEKQKPYFSSMAKSQADYMLRRSSTEGYRSLSAKYGVNVSKYYSEHYEEAFRNKWSKSSSTYGYTEMIGRGIGAAVSTGLMLSMF